MNNVGPILKVDRLKKSFGDMVVLSDISFELFKGKTMVAIGPSGTGKSTLLRCINRLDDVDRGHIWLDGIDLTDPKANIDLARSQIGFVFQSFNLFTHLTALENVAFGPRRVKNMDKEESRKLAMLELERVGLADKAHAYPAQLSGGQQQRVSIARALALEPKLILYDEPTSALDPQLIGEVLSVMTDLAESGMTALVVTHEMGFARSVSDEIIFMDEGRIIEQGPPDKVIVNPENERTRYFLKKITDH